jgi:hypothetical protein
MFTKVVLVLKPFNAILMCVVLGTTYLKESIRRFNTKLWMHIETVWNSGAELCEGMTKVRTESVIERLL